MNKKLKKYIDKEADKYTDDFDPEKSIYQYTPAAVSLAYINGFNAAISLELPTKFEEWCRHDKHEGYKNIVRRGVLCGHSSEKISKDLFEYWLDNEYEIE